MKPEIKQKWLAALRSGQYTHGQSALRRANNTYCCLGVLCDLYIKETGNGKWDTEPGLIQVRDESIPTIPFHDTAANQSDSCMLTQGVREWAGLPKNLVFDHGDITTLPLTELNDNKDTTSFEPTITYIEQTF